MSDKSVQPSNVTEVRPFDRFRQYVAERAEVQGDFNPEELEASQVDKILTADSEEALFEAMGFDGLTGLKDLDDGTRITIHNYRLVQGTLGSLGVYTVIDATDDDTGEALALDTGIPRVVGFLRMAEQLDLFPVSVTVVKKTTGNDNTMVSLRKTPRPAVKSNVA